MQQPATAMQDVMAERDRLERTWAVPRGVIVWLSAADHKSIGKRFIVTTFIFFLLGGIQVGGDTLLRFYVMHVIAFPLITAIFLIVHFWRIRKDGGISGPV